jgi:acyl carrier protein
MDPAPQPSFNPESFRASLTDALAPDGSLTLLPETKIRTLSVWDSIASVSIVAMVYAEYDVQISGKELMGCETVSAVSDLVAEKLAASL